MVPAHRRLGGGAPMGSWSLRTAVTDVSPRGEADALSHSSEGNCSVFHRG